MRAFRPILTLLCIAAALLSSCRRAAEERRPTIPYVREILASRNGPEMGVLRRAAAPAVADDITVIGPSGVCDRFSDLFSRYDRRDNVDGRYVRDALPDFAGETLVCIADDSLAAVPQGDEEAVAFRERTVREVLCALDTALHISPYDMEGLGSKKSSKLIILAGVNSAQYGGFDADTLFRSSGCGISLLSPLDLALDRVMSSPRRLLNVGILYDDSVSSGEVCSARFALKAAESGHGGSLCYTMPTGDRDSLMHRLVRSYLASGHGGALDAVIVDDLSADIDALKNELAGMVSIMNESSMTYGRLISREFVMVNPFDETAAAVYDKLRKYNLFTHNIAKPLVVTCRPVPKPEAGDASIILIPGSYVQN